MGGERLDTRNPTSKLMLTILAGVATWEREIMLERQREGIALRLPYVRSRWSSASRRPSPSRLNASTVTKIARPGNSVRYVATPK